MSISHSPKIVTDGLTFYTDARNKKKSWMGAPTTNLLSTPLSSWPRSTAITSVTGGTLAPDGTYTAYTVTADGSTNSYISLGGSLLSGQTYAKSVIAKAGTTSTLVFESYDNNGSGGIAYFATTFNLAAGTYSGTGHTATITNLGDGWFLCTTVRSYTLNTLGGTFYIGTYGNGTGTLHLWNPQMEQSTTSNRYVNGTRSNTQALLDMTGSSTLTVNNLVYASDDTFNFNGTNTCNITCGVQTYGNNATWSAWIYPTANGNTYNMFMARYLPYFAFQTGNRLLFSTNIGGTQRSLSTAANLSINNWYHASFTVSYDGANTTMKIFTNSVETATATYAGTIGNSANQFVIGDWLTTASAYPYTGKVDSVMIYNRTLTPAEIASNFNATRGLHLV